MKKTLLLTIAAVLSTGAVTIAAPAAARDHHYSSQRYNDGYGRYGNDNRRYDSRYDRYDRREDRRYRNERRYRQNDDSRYRCDKGTGGTVIGAIAGGLAGHEIAGRGDRTLGAILGGAVGAIAGRAIDKSNDGCR